MDTNQIDPNEIAWYQSTQGPQIAATVKGIVGLIFPLIQSLFHLTTGIDLVDRLIDAALILGFGAYALFGYVRAKRTLAAEITSLQGQIKRLNGTGQSS